MPVGRIARQNGSDGIDLQIKFSFTVPPVPLRGNGVNSPARLHRLGSLKRAGSRLIPANLPKSCSINITATQRFSLVTELRTVGVGWARPVGEFHFTNNRQILENCSSIGQWLWRVLCTAVKTESRKYVRAARTWRVFFRDVVNPWNFEQSLVTARLETN